MLVFQGILATVNKYGIDTIAGLIRNFFFEKGTKQGGKIKD